jgi:YD repeat-containing protein
MSAVISGNGLGLFDTSLNTLGGSFGSGSQVGTGSQYVNIATGNLVLQSQDEQLLFRGLPVAQLRTYNSLGLVSQTGSDGWLTGFERSVALVSGTVNSAGSVMRRYTGDGAFQDFLWNSASNAYQSITGDGAHDALTWTAASRTWTYVEGSTRREEQYADHADATLKGRLTRIRDLTSDGTTPATFDVLYDASNRITEIRSNDGTATGDALVFGYNGAGQLASVSTRENGVLLGQVTYGYENPDGSGRLVWVQTDLTPQDTTDNTWDAVTAANNDGRRFRTSYTYEGSSLRLSSVTQSDGTLTGYTYDASGRVLTVTRGDSNSNDADGLGETQSFSYGASSTTVTDSLGRAWVYAFDAARELTGVTAPAVGGVSDFTSYSYDPSGNLTQVKTVRGAKTLRQCDYRYDVNGNQTGQWELVQGTAATAITRTFNADNQLLSETRYTGLDPDGAPSADGTTGTLGATAGLTTSYIYDAQDRLRFVVDAMGGVRQIAYASSGNGMGQQASVRQYLGAAYSGTLSESALATWAAGQIGNSTLTESSYDLCGRLSQITAYDVVDGNSGAGWLDSVTSITRFTYDAQGLLRQQIVVHGTGRTLTGTAPATSEVTDYAYDGMGRLLSVLRRDAATAANDDSNTVATTYAYLDSGQQIRLTNDAGATHVELRNAAGRLLSVVDADTAAGGSTTRITQDYYDTAGQLRASRDAGGGISYLFYDEQGRLEATIDATGAVTRNAYEGDRVVQTTTYANRVTTTSWLSGNTVTKARFSDVGVVTDLANDRNRYAAYDTAGRLVTQTDAANTITSYSYDGADRLLQVQIGNAGTTDPVRTTRYFYDDANRVTCVLDGEGYLIETAYNLQGKPVTVMRYATVSPAAQWANGTLAQLRPAVDALHDQVTRYYYDGRGNQVGTLEAEGYLTETIYDEAGNARAVNRYATQLTWATGDTVASLRNRAGSYQQNRQVYNALGQLTAQTNPEGTLTNFYYDEAGRLVRTETAATTTEVRDDFRRYNAFGEVVADISGEAAEAARTTLLGGKYLNDPSLTPAQLDNAYASYGTRYTLDAFGRNIEAIDAQGNKTWRFYDYAGHPTFVVRGVAQDNAGVTRAANSYGEVTETRYNAFGQVVDTIAYTGRIGFAVPGDRASVANALPLSIASTDTHRQYTYTTRGLLASVTDAENTLNQYTYNAFGERSHATLAVGKSEIEQLDYTYDRRGLLIGTTEALGTSVQRATTAIYDAFGRVVTGTDARLTPTTYTYDRLGRQLTHSTTVQGRVETWINTYDAYARVLTTTDALTRTTNYLYNDAAHSVTVTTPEGVDVTTVHNRYGQTVTVRDGLGHVTTCAYDDDGHLISVTDPLNQTSAREYDSKSGLLMATVDSSGRRVELHYDAVGRVLTRVEDPGSVQAPGLALTNTYQYDAQGRQIKVTDPSGRICNYSYDRESRLTQVAQDPAGLNLRTTYTYDALGRQVTVTQGDGGANPTLTQYNYDALGRRICEIVDPHGLALTTSYVYDANDNVIRRIDANQQTTRFYYDQANRLFVSVSPLGEMTRNWYDADGRLVATRQFGVATDVTTLSDATTLAQLDARLDWNTSKPYQGEYRIYDRDGRLTFVLSAAGALEERTYDAGNHVILTRRYAAPATFSTGPLFAGTALPGDIDTASIRNDALDQLTYHVYDSAGRLTISFDALGNTRQYRYDAAGRQIAITRYANPITATALAGQKAAVLAGTATATGVVGAIALAPTQDTVTYQVYDAAGRARYTLDAIGALRETLYDPSGRVIGLRAYATAITVDSTLLGKLQTGTAGGNDITAKLTIAIASDVRNTEHYQVFDAAGRITDTIDFVRDASGNATGTVQQTDWDDAGRTVRQAGLLGTLSTATLNTHLTELQAGTARRADVLAWLGATSDSHYTQFVLDAAGRIRYTLTRDSVTTLQVTGHQYDNAGRLIFDCAYATSIATTTALTVTTVAAAITAAGGDVATNQRVTRRAYDADGQLRFVIDNTGAVTESRFDGLGRVVEERRYGTTIAIPAQISEASVAAAVAGVADVRITTTVYDAAGRVKSSVDANLKTEYYGYDSIGRRISYTDKLGNTWTYAYDAAGRKISETSPPVAVAMVLDDGSVPAPVVRAVVTRYTYDALDNVLTRTEDYGQATARTTTYQYDSRGHQIRTVFPRAWQIDPATNTLIDNVGASEVDVTYNALGQAVVQKDVRGFYSYNVYDDLGRLAYQIDQNNNVTGYAYDALGQQTKLTRYANALVTSGTAFTSVGWTPGQAISLSQVHVGLSVNAADRTLSTTYDLRGNKASVVQAAVAFYRTDGTPGNGSPTTLFTYNAYGEMVQQSVLIETTDSNAVWTNTYHYYDRLGREVLTVDAEGYVTKTAFDALGQTTEVVEYARAVSLANVTSDVTPALPQAGDASTGYDRVTRYTYDAMGRKASESVRHSYVREDGSIAFDTVDKAFTYSNDGHLTQQTVDGVATQMVYDVFGRTSALIEPERNVLAVTGLSQLGAVASDLGTASLYEKASPYTMMEYDAFGNVVRTRRYANGLRGGVATPDDDRDSITINRYDRQGRNVETIDALGNRTYSHYDAADHLLHQQSTLTGSTAELTAVIDRYFQYDALGRQVETQAKRKIGAAAQTTDHDEWVAYNAFGEITDKATSQAGLSASTRLHYSYDLSGQLTSNNESGGARTFGFDLAGHQVIETRYVTLYTGTGAITQQVTYRNVTDKLGRVVETILPSNVASASATSTVVNTLDRWGNVVAQIDPRGYVTYTEFNESNQVVRQIGPPVEVVGEDGLVRWQSPETHWVYDNLGRLLETRDANGHVQGNAYDAAGQLIRSVDALGATTLHAYDASGNAVVQQNALGYLTWQQFDARGQVVKQGDLTLNPDGSRRVSTDLEAYVLNENGDRVRVTNALLQTDKYDYNSADQLVRHQTAANVITTYEYDAAGRKTLERNALGGQLSWTSDVYGRVAGHGDLAGNNFDYTYDNLSGELVHQQSTADTSATVIPGGLEAGATDPMDRADQRTTYYYANGLTRRVEEPGGVWSAYEYDANGNRTLEQTHTYDGRGLLVYVRTRTSYDSHNRVSHVYSEALNSDGTTNAVQLDLRYGYDAVGNRRVVVADSGYAFTVGPAAPDAAPNLIGTPQSVFLKAGVATQLSLRAMDIFQDPEQQALTFSATFSSSATWLKFDANQFAATGELALVADSSTTAGQSVIVHLTAMDTAGKSRTVDFTINVAADSPPTASSNNAPLVMLVGADSTLELDVGDYFNDVNAGDSLSLSLVSLSPSAPWLTVDASTPGVLRLSGKPTATGTYTLTLRAIDGSGQSVTRTVQLKVETNATPASLAVSTQTAVINRPFLFECPVDQLFTDSNGDRLAITATLAGGASLPTWLNLQEMTDIDPPTVRLVGYVPPNVSPQTLSVVLTATDPYGATISRSFTLNVITNPAPVVLTTPAIQQAQVLNLYNATLNIADYFREDQGDFFGLSIVRTTQNNWLYFQQDGAAGTFSLVGTPPDNSKSGQYIVQIKATDSDGASSLLNITFNVATQTPPVFPTTGSVSVVTSSPFSFQMKATDVEGDLLTYRSYVLVNGGEGYMDEEPLPTWLGFSNGTYSGTAPSTAWTKTIYIEANDGTNAPVVHSFVLSVGANQGVSLNGTIPNATVQVKSNWTYTVPAGLFSDPEGQTLTYSATGMPSGVTFDANLRKFSGAPTQSGVFAITVLATDPGGASNQTTFQLSVTNTAPVYNGGLVNKTMNIGGAVNWLLPASTFTDADGQSLTYGALVEIPAHNRLKWNSTDNAYDEVPVAAQWVSLATAGLTINASTGTITGTPGKLTADALDFYSYRIQVSASDGTASAPGTFLLSLNRAPATGTVIPGAILPRNISWSYVVPTSAFSDPEGGALTYSATGMPAGVSFSTSSKTFSGVPTTNGTYSIVVKVTDSGGLTASQTFSVTVQNYAPVVANPIPAQSIAQSKAWTFAFAANTFTDANNDALTYTASGMPPGITFAASTRTFSGTPTTTGNYTVTVNASDGTATKATTFVITVNGSGPPALNTPLANQTCNAGAYFEYIFSANTFSGTGLNYTATRSDGTALPAWLTFSSTLRKFSGTAPAGTADVTYTIKVTATNTQGSASGTFTLEKIGSGTSAMVAQSSQPTSESTSTSSTSLAPATDSTSSSTVTAAATTAALQQDLAINPVTAATAYNVGSASKVFWYTYDADNRTLVHEGALQNGQVVIGSAGYEQRYDAAGQQTLRVTPSYKQSGSYERTTYDLRGEITGVTSPTLLGQGESPLVESRKYNDAGRLTQIIHNFRPGFTVDVKGTVMDISGFLDSIETYLYDGDGRVLTVTQQGRSQEVDADGVTLKWQLNLLGTFNDQAVRATQCTDQSVLRTASTTSYSGMDGTHRLGYDAAGNLLGYKFVVPDDAAIPGYSQTYLYTYQGREQYQEKTVAGTSTLSDFKATTVTSYYDAAGRRIAVEEDTPAVSTDHTLRYFSYDEDGDILTRRDGRLNSTSGWIQPSPGAPKQAPGEPLTYPDNPIPERISNSAWQAMSDADRSAILKLAQDQRFVYVNGQQVSHGTQAGTLGVIDGLTAYGDAGAGRTQVTAQPGDTLRSIALRVYGNANLWYVLADANAIGADKQLTAGVSLTVPALKVNSNDASTFKPYDPGQVIGSTTPNLPYIAPPLQHCNDLEMVLLVVVAVVVTYFTAGAASTYFAGVFAGSGAAVGTAAAATVVAGSAASVAGGIVGGFVGGVVGSIASQAVGSALGVSQFSWKQVLADGITNAVTYGAGKYMQGEVGTLATATGKLTTTGRVLEGVIGYGGSVVGNAAVGKDAHFSWNAVAANVVGSYLSAKLGGELPINQGGSSSDHFIEDFAGQFVNGGINATARRVFGLGKQDWGQIEMDAFGNAVANVAIGKGENWKEQRRVDAQQREDLDINVEQQKALQRLTPKQQQIYEINKRESGVSHEEAMSLASPIYVDSPSPLTMGGLASVNASLGYGDDNYSQGLLGYKGGILDASPEGTPITGEMLQYFKDRRNGGLLSLDPADGVDSAEQLHQLNRQVVATTLASFGAGLEISKRQANLAQSILAAAGLNLGPTGIDGDYGSRSATASKLYLLDSDLSSKFVRGVTPSGDELRDLQAILGVKSTGNFGPKTRSSLVEALRGSQTATRVSGHSSGTLASRIRSFDERYGSTIQTLSQGYGIPRDIFAAIAFQETAGGAMNKPRFESAWYSKLSLRQAKGDIELAGLPNQAIRDLSTSWGMGQIMGFESLKNNSLYKVATLAEIKSDDPAKQLQLMAQFIANKGGGKLLEAARTRNWEKIAAGYNGASWRKFNPNYAKDIALYSTIYRSFGE